MAIALCNPEVGFWYRDIQNRLFEVLALDDDDTIEVQYIDGDITEYDRESWDMLCVNVISDPGLSQGFSEDAQEESERLYSKLETISWEHVIGDVDS